MNRVSQSVKLIIISALISAGCSKQQSAEEHLNAAKQYVSEAQPSKALIELKNALSKQQDLHDARQLLGATYLSQGDYLAAEIEFNKLLNAGYEDPDLLVNLAQARHLMQEHQSIPDLWDKAKGLSSAQRAQLGFYTYVALSKIENEKKVSGLVEQLFLNIPEQTYTKLVIAYQQAAKKNATAAMNTVETVLLAEPNNAEALLFKGQLDLYNQNFADAANAFEQYLTLVPNHTIVELYFADAMFKNKQYELVAPHVEMLLKKAPNFGYINYLQGMLYFTKNNFEDAKFHLEKAIQANTNIEQSKLYAGLSAYRTGHLEQAYEYLNDVIELMPDNDDLRRLLSTVQFKLGYNIEASDSIAQLTKLSESDLVNVNNAAYSYLQRGQNKQAAQLIEQASSIDTDNAKEITRLGMLKVSLQDMSGIVDIKKAIQLDNGLEEAKVALVQAYLGQGLTDDALQVAEQWIKESPNNLVSYNLAGFVAIQNRDTVLAEHYLQKALELDDGNSASLMFFASKARSEGDLDLALKYLGKLANNNLNYIPGLVNNYLVSKSAGKAQDGLDVIKLAYNQSPDNSQLASVYARALYTEGHYRQVINLFKKMNSTRSRSNFYWSGYVNSYLKIGDRDNAIKVAKQWVDSQSTNFNAWLTYFTVHGLENYSKAKEIVSASIKYFPENIALKLLLVDLSIKIGDIEKARNLIYSDLKDVSSIRKTFLAGKLAMLDKEYRLANSLFSEVFSNHGNIDVAIMYAESFRLLGNNTDALKVIEQELVADPDNFKLNFNRAVIVSKIDMKSGEDLYRKLVESYPENILVLNNLAAILLKLDQPKEALSVALKAYSKGQNFLPVIDTLANAYEENNDLNNSIRLNKILWNNLKSFEYGARLVSQLVKVGNIDDAELVYNQIKPTTEEQRLILKQAING